MDKVDFQVIVTIGPSSMDEGTIKRIDACGPCIFRINGAYIDVNKVKALRDRIISFVPDAKILLDFPSDKKWFLARNKKLKTQFLTAKDKALIKKVCHIGIDYLGMSHVLNVDNISEVKKLISKQNEGHPELICKIETTSALMNLESILHEVSYILVDRGDLAKEIGTNELPKQQEIIINQAKLHSVNVILATNFLKTMETEHLPSIPEAIDLYKTIQDEVAGVQMSEETAIGMFPVKCVEYVFNLYKIYKRTLGVAWNPMKKK